MQYFEVEPAAELRRHVRCIWGLRVRDETQQLQRVLPDGCSEYVIHLGDRFRQLNNGTAWQQPREMLVGPTARAILLQPGVNADVIGIRLEPGSTMLLTRARPAELRDGVLDACDAGASLAGDVIDLLTPVSDAERVSRLEQLLLRRMHATTIDKGVEHARALISGSHGRARVSDLAVETGLSERTFHRRFSESVGLSAKTLSRIARVQHALLLARRPGATLAQVAAESGYADQAHFTRDFRDIAGVAPREYWGGQHELNEVFLGAEADSGN